MSVRPASEFAQTSIPAPGIIGVDWEERVDFTRLRDYRTSRAREALENSDLGAVLVFESSNIRYLTATHIGTWGYNKTERWALLTRTGEPWVWDFGSAAKNHRMYSPWLLPEHSNGGNTGLQGAISPLSGLPRGPRRRSPRSSARRASPECHSVLMSLRYRCSASLRPPASTSVTASR